MNHYKLLDVNIEDLKNVCGHFLYNDKEIHDQDPERYYDPEHYTFKYDRENCHLDFYFSRRDLHAYVNLDYMNTYLSSIRIDECEYIKVVDFKNKVIEVHGSNSKNLNSISAFIHLLNYPIVSINSQDSLDHSSHDVFDYDIIGMFDKMIENSEDQSMELIFQKEEVTVHFTIYPNNNNCKLEFKSDDKILNTLSFMNYQSIRILNLKNKCFEILGFKHEQMGRTRCFISLNENCIANIETNYQTEMEP